MSKQKSLSGPHTLHPLMDMAPGYACTVFIQRAHDPMTGRAFARSIASESPHLRGGVKVSPQLHR